MVDDEIKQKVNAVKNEAQFLAAVGLHRAFAVDARAQIAMLLKKFGELTVTDITSYLNMSEPNISEHLRILKSGLFVRSERHGKYIYYSFNDDFYRQSSVAAAEALNLPA